MLWGGTVVDKSSEDILAQKALARLQQRLDVDRQLSQLSLGARQMIELARTLSHGARILILDEPTSALSTSEAAALFRVVEESKASGVSIVYISHRLHELLYLGDYFTVLRSGQVVGESTRAQVTRERIVERMSGRAEELISSSPNLPRNAEIELEARGLTLAPSVGDEAAQAPVHDVSFSLRKGEIVCIYGLLGAGRTELVEALAGNRKLSGGHILVRGKAVRIDSVRDAIRAGIVLVPEDRQRDGLIPDLSIRENIALAAASVDGEGVYKVRFMPDALGEWTYTTDSSTPSLKGKTGTFETVSPRAENHGPVRVRNVYHFGYLDGTPNFPFGTTCYAWVHQSETLQEETLSTLRTGPFNKLRMCIFPKWYQYNHSDPPLFPFPRQNNTNVPCRIYRSMGDDCVAGVRRVLR